MENEEFIFSRAGFRPKGGVQDFQKIRERCMQSGCLFEDPAFPASDSSIYYYSKPDSERIRWRRPFELSDEPRLFVEGASRFDVVQGELGDCWLLAAVANLTFNDSLFFRVVPNDQSFVKDYAGVFHFRFWQYGTWVDIVVDDRLPTRDGKLVYMHSKSNNEFWSALLEKAYAKLHGSYEALSGGLACEAMVDFTGGINEAYELSKAPPNFYKILHKAFDRGSLLSCFMEKHPYWREAVMPNGLIRQHAYSITKVKVVDVQTSRFKGKFELLRLRNPWGNDLEWNDSWSDRSQEWTLISDEEKERLELKFDSDGEFWIPYCAFMDNFQWVEICHLNPDSLDDEPLTEKSKKKWEMSMFQGSWTENFTAGGRRDFKDTFWLNPQFGIVLEDVDADDDDNLCTIIVALMQNSRRCNLKMRQRYLEIGFAIYYLKNPLRLPKPLPKEFFERNKPIAGSHTFTWFREMSIRFKLLPGTYCIVPCTFNPNEEGDFVLRVFAEKRNVMTEYDEEIGIANPDDEVKLQETEEEKSKQQKVKDFFASTLGSRLEVESRKSNLEVDCYDLQKILKFALKKDLTSKFPTSTKEHEFEGFSLDVCRSMVSMMDVNRSGKLGLEEFKNLWMDIRTWKNVFKKYDVDQSGYLNTIELRGALHSAGYRLNSHVLRALVLRYGKKGKVTFDDFIMCAVKLKTLIETFLKRDPCKTMRATFTLDEWVEKTMYS